MDKIKDPEIIKKIFMIGLTAGMLWASIKTIPTIQEDVDQLKIDVAVANERYSNIDKNINDIRNMLSGNSRRSR